MAYLFISLSITAYYDFRSLLLNMCGFVSLSLWALNLDKPYS